MPVVTFSPVQISGNPPDTDLGTVGKQNHVGPFEFGSDLYLILVTGANQTLQAYKSIDNGSNWTLDATGEDTAQENFFATADSGTAVEIIYSIVGSNAMAYITFTPGSGFSAPIVSTEGNVNCRSCRFSDGTFLSIYERIAGGLRYERFSSGSWSLPVTAFTAAVNTAQIYGLVGDSSNTGHFVYSLSGTGNYRTLTSGGSVSSATVLPAGVGVNSGPMELWNDRLIVPFVGNPPGILVGTPVAAPVWSSVAITPAVGAGTFTMVQIIDATHLAVFWDTVSTQQWNYSIYDGATFGPLVFYYDATNLPPPGGYPPGDNFISAPTVNLLSDGSFGVALRLLYDDGSFLRSMFYLLPPLAIDCNSPPDGTVGVPYSHFLQASGGLPPYTFFLFAGALPDGLSLNTVTGEISGTPTLAGTFAFTVRVTDANLDTAFVECSITIDAAPPPLAITCDNPPDGTVGTPYSHFFPATGGTPPYAFSLHAGALPDGLSLDPVTGELAGTPTLAGLFTFTIQVTDADLNTANVECSITINPAGGVVVIECNDPPPGKVGVFYSHTLGFSGGTPPYTFVILAGSLPPGLSINLTTGVISGKPTAYGIYSFTVQVTDFLGATGTVTCSITIRPNQYLFGDTEQLLCETRYPWMIPPEMRTPWKSQGSITAPALNVTTLIWEYLIPDGFYLVLDRIQHAYSPAGLFDDGSGAVLWSIDVNNPVGNPLPTWRPVAQFTGQMGNFGKPFPVGPLQFRGGDTVRYKVVITDPAVPIGFPNVISALGEGWLYPVARSAGV